ncbi:MAG: PAS domain S-box protein [Betaproteobacteria bacterium]|nr:PAS domain S-box protein [Betaproteobacteria bacterium]
MNPRLLLALLLPLFACGLQWLLWEHLQPYVWLLLLPAAFGSAWLDGLRGGLAGSLIGAALAWYFFVPPVYSFRLERFNDGLSIVLFVGLGGLFAWFQEQLRRARQRIEIRYDATFEQAAVGLALVAPDGHWLRVNRKLCAIVGYAPEELLGKTFQDITHPDDLNTDLEFVRRMLARELSTYSMEKRYRRKDGAEVWINLTVALVWSADGAPDYFISVVEDIQARKQVEGALRTSERSYRTLFDSMMNGFAHCRMLYEDGVASDFIYLAVNPAFTELTGLRDVTGRRVSEVIPGLRASNPEMIEIYGRVARGGGPERFEAFVEALGMWFSVAVHSPQPDHFVAVFDVITERKRAETELQRRNQELERFDAASVGRELQMIELKGEINELARQLGRTPPYDLGFVTAQEAQ